MTCKILSLFILPLLPVITIAQLDTPDVINTPEGQMFIQPVLHSTMVLTWDQKTIYVDPYGGADLFKDFLPPDMILITDIHGDHMNLETLNTLETSGAVLVVPPAVKELLPDDLKEKSVVLSNGEMADVLNIPIEALAMYNLPESADSRHPKGRGNGYILQLGSQRVYISGDTEDIPEMRSLEDIDIAFVCMNQPFTMSIEQAASAVLDFKPKVVYPFHYRGREGLSDVEAFKKLVIEVNPEIEVRLKKWYP